MPSRFWKPRANFNAEFSCFAENSLIYFCFSFYCETIFFGDLKVETFESLKKQGENHGRKINRAKREFGFLGNQ